MNNITDLLPLIFNPETLVNALLIAVGVLAACVVTGTVCYYGGYVLLLLYKYRKREQVSLDSVLLQIAVPRENEYKIDAAEQLFAGLASLRKGGRFAFLSPQPFVSFEIVGQPSDIRFYVYTPNKLRDLVEKQINATYPDADIRVVDEKDPQQKRIIGNEYNIFSETGKVAFATLKLKGQKYQPIKLFKDMPVDGMSLLTSTLAKMEEGEGAAIQIMVSASDNKWKKFGRKFISQTKKREANPETAKYGVDPKELEGVENKIGKPGFDVVVRVVVSAQSQERANQHLSNITGTFGQFGGANSFKKVKPFFKNLVVEDFVYRYWPMHDQTSVMSSEELATLFHFPNRSITTPHIFWLTSKRAPAPTQIATQGTFIGNSTFRGATRPVYVDLDDRRRHLYIIGKSGTGKSQLLKSLSLQDIEAGRGVCVIDPHGDLIEQLLLRIPASRANDVIVFDPSDENRPMGLNIMEAYGEMEKHYMVSSIIGLFYKLYDPHKTGIVGPRLEHAIRNVMLTVMSEPGGTFIEVQRALTDSKFVQELLPKVTDPIIKRYWTDQIAQTSDFHKSEVLDYIVSKFSRFTTNKLMRNIIGQSKSAFTFRDVMDNKKILLVNLSKGKLQEENSNFLGLVLIPKILAAALSRQDIPEEQREDFFLYVDEFQNFATSDFSQIFSEARKYRLNLTVANQFIGQMDEEVKNAVFGNVGTLVSFRVGIQDANFLQHEFQPVFSEQDLINIDAQNAYVRTTVNGAPVTPFSIDTHKDWAREQSLDNPQVAELLKELSRAKFGRDAMEVEREIQLRAKL